jgi:hypothetical protein
LSSIFLICGFGFTGAYILSVRSGGEIEILPYSWDWQINPNHSSPRQAFLPQRQSRLARILS